MNKRNVHAVFERNIPVVITLYPQSFEKRVTGENPSVEVYTYPFHWGHRHITTFPLKLSAMPDVSELFRKVRQVEIVARRTVNELFAGQYKSVFRGRGMEFSEVREYQPGDDIRSIDWNVMARVGKPFIKRFEEERELTILFLVDVSSSGIFGSTRSKIETSIETAATLMFSALKNHDKVGLLTFADKVIRFYPPRKGKANVLHLLRELIVAEPTGNHTDLLSALEYINRTQKRRSVVFVLSDFFVTGLLPNEDLLQEYHDQSGTPQQRQKMKTMLSDLHQRESYVTFRQGPRRYPLNNQTATEKALSICARKHDVIAMMLTDMRERTFPAAGLIALQDAETGEWREVDCGNAYVRQSLSEYVQRVHDHIDVSLKRCRIDSLRIESGSNFLVSLRKFFRSREKRRV